MSFVVDESLKLGSVVYEFRSRWMGSGRAMFRSLRRMRNEKTESGMNCHTTFWSLSTN